MIKDFLIFLVLALYFLLFSTCYKTQSKKKEDTGDTVSDVDSNHNSKKNVSSNTDSEPDTDIDTDSVSEGTSTNTINSQITILEGYLVNDCPWSAFPYLPDLDSECQLDVLLSEVEPNEPIPDICGGDSDPFASTCHFSALGYSIQRNVYVRVKGFYTQTEICELVAKGEPAICDQDNIFIPTEIIEIM